jgi:hypothetical protein
MRACRVGGLNITKPDSIFSAKGGDLVTKLLESAISRIKNLPEEEQDSIAQIILEELEDEKMWDEQFARSQDKLAAIAKKVKEDKADGRTTKTGWDEL